MKRVLLIKLTSLGDLIHALPALSDAYLACPGISFDWVIDENFQEVASWHPAVDKIFTTNHRTWRHGLFKKSTYRTIFSLFRSIRQTDYDLVIDGQGNFKSALFSLFTKGIRAGFDRHSVREYVAHFAYQEKHSASRKSHAVERLRRLFSSALNYPMPKTEPNFMIDRDRFAKPSFDLPESYLLFIHNAGWSTKLWPEEHWLKLIQMGVEAGYPILLPWGNQMEKERAERLAKFPQVRVLPKLSLSEMGYVIAGASGCVSMDTGLSHLAAALEIPSVTLYGATDSGLIGANGKSQLHLQSTIACAPCNQKQCRFPKEGLHPPCLAAITPERVFESLKRRVLSRI